MDALRALAVMFGVVYHCARVFGVEPWHIQNAEPSAVLDALARGSSLFRMPLLFLLAGTGTFFALRRRSAAAYARERAQRLLVPLLFGVLVIVPPQVYVERLNQGAVASVSLLAFYPSVFTTGAYPDGNFALHHLWFLRDLFALSLVALPLFLLARRSAGAAALAAAGRLGARQPWLAVVGPAAVLVLVELVWRGHVRAADFLHFLVLFVAGYALAAIEGAELVVDRLWRPAAVFVVALLPFRLAIPAWGMAEAPAVLRGGDAVLEWVGLLAVLGLGARYLRRPIGLLRSAADVAYPFYIWHQLVIVLLAYPLVRVQGPVAWKFTALLSSSFVTTLLLSRAVLLTGPTRVLFGVKGQGPTGARAPVTPELPAAPAPAPGS